MAPDGGGALALEELQRCLLARRSAASPPQAPAAAPRPAQGGAQGGAQSEFLQRKRQILASLDRSPKGSLDAPIVDFLAWLNEQPAVVTTSSCSGRIAIFLGSADAADSKGGEWLEASHERLQDAPGAWRRLLGDLAARAPASLQGTLTTFSLEPFLLHAECASVEVAQRILAAARECGFRESGVSLGRRRVLVHVRTTALRLDAPLAVDGRPLVTQDYFEVLVGLANARLDENHRRVDRFWAQLRSALAGAPGEEEGDGGEPWVLSCPQPLARAVKLAVEARGWMDASRKMAPLPEADGQPPCLGIPLTAAGAAELADLGEDCDLADGVRPTEVERASGPSGGAARRPETTAADLPALWAASRAGRGPLALLRSGGLPGRARAAPGAQQRSPEAEERAAVARAVSQVWRSCADAGAPCPAPLAELLADVDAAGRLQWRGDAALLPRGALAGPAWDALAAAAPQLWEELRRGVGARLLVRQREIRVDDEVRGGAVEVLATSGEGDGWVVVPGPRGVRYALDVTRCMFSEGNAAEKGRVAAWPVRGETVLDLYAGIGFWTLPLLAAGAAHVFSCEWNPDALEALRAGLALAGDDVAARCTVLPGDNRRPEVRAATAARCHRVVLGLIPTSRDGLPAAVAALRPEGGLLHVHWNVASDAEDATARGVTDEVRALLRSTRGGAWDADLLGVQRIKWFAPRVRHVRIDVRCAPAPC